MNILDKIVIQKKIEIEQAKQQFSIKQLEDSYYFKKENYAVTENFKKENNTGIIAEFKRQSPSKGIINDKANVVEVVKGYENAGVVASSILTDNTFFGGSKNDLMEARKEVQLPLLRKDFMIDEYQFIEAKNWGADIVLLIAAILTPKEVRNFTDIAQNLGLEVLLELHNETELNHVYHKVNMVGINNRNLKTFEVDVEQSIKMSEHLGNDFIKIAESGISNINTLKYFKQNGFQGFLIGENFMKTEDPSKACHAFIEQL
jgi:indole-3-glycerol phosphate synthase